MVGPELGRERDAIAESVILIIRSARKAATDHYQIHQSVHNG